MSKKVYTHGDRASIYLARSIPKEIINWINEQDDISESILKAIAFNIHHNGITNLSKKEINKSLEEFANVVASSPPKNTTKEITEDTSTSPVHEVTDQNATEAQDINETESFVIGVSAWEGLGAVDDDDIM